MLGDCMLLGAVAEASPLDLTGFSSPSGNVGCIIDALSVRSGIAEHDWAPPPRPADCPVDYGQGISLSAGGRPEFVCAGDTAPGGSQVLAYGDSIGAGALRCESADSGITWRDVQTGHGFSITREAYRLF